MAQLFLGVLTTNIIFLGWSNTNDAIIFGWSETIDTIVCDTCDTNDPIICVLNYFAIFKLKNHFYSLK